MDLPAEELVREMVDDVPWGMGPEPLRHNFSFEIITNGYIQEHAM